MSRITGSEVVNLMEAYSAVYAPQELTEEQIWEEVENWVNSLLEEGYDLSEYTWEEMYEAYIEEQGPRSSRGVKDPAVQARWRSIGNTLATGNPEGRTTPRKPSGREQMRQRMQQSRPGATPPAKTPAAASASRPPSRFAGARDAAFARAQQIQGSPVVGPRQPAATARPAAPAPAARPATAPVATSRPAADAKTAPAPAAAPATTASPARPSLSSQADEIRKMRAASLARQGKTLDAATVSASTRPAYQANSFDPFDVIKGHLIDEGYADTEDAALKIMANMSEEWKKSIVEQLNPDAPGNTHSLADLYKAQEKWQRDQVKKKKEPKSGGSGAASQAKDV